MLIGITGYKGSGKSTVANIMVDNGYTKLPFAKALKDGIKVMLGVGDGHLYGDQKEARLEVADGKNTRWCMATLGTDWGRNLISPDIWVNIVRKKIREEVAKQKCPPHELNIVIDDVRFSNEIEMLRGMGATIIHVKRPGHGPFSQGSTLINWWSRTLHYLWLDRVHPSELGVPGIDGEMVIDNTSTLWGLELNANSVLKKLGAISTGGNKELKEKLEVMVTPNEGSGTPTEDIEPTYAHHLIQDGWKYVTLVDIEGNSVATRVPNTIPYEDRDIKYITVVDEPEWFYYKLCEILNGARSDIEVTYRRNKEKTPVGVMTKGSYKLNPPLTKSMEGYDEVLSFLSKHHCKLLD